MAKLSQYLTSKKILQKDFAVSIEATQATVSRLVNESMTPGAKLALRIDKATGGEVPFAVWYQEGEVTQ